MWGGGGGKGGPDLHLGVGVGVGARGRHRNEGCTIKSQMGGGGHWSVCLHQYSPVVSRLTGEKAEIDPHQSLSLSVCLSLSLSLSLSLFLSLLKKISDADIIVD